MCFEIRMPVILSALLSNLFRQIHTASVFNGEHPFDETDFETIYRLLLSGCFAGRGDKALVKNALMEIPVRGQNCLITKDPTGMQSAELADCGRKHINSTY